MMHGATATSAIQLCTLIKTEKTVSLLSEQRNMLHFAFNFFFLASNGTPLQYSCLERPMDGGA